MNQPTHCLRGHEYTVENTSWRTRKDRAKPSRVCKCCRRDGRSLPQVHRRGSQPEDVRGDELHQWLLVRAHETGLNMSDHECVHGRLPGDRNIQCDCWEVSDASVGTTECLAGTHA